MCFLPRPAAPVLGVADGTKNERHFHALPRETSRRHSRFNRLFSRGFLSFGSISSSLGLFFGTISALRFVSFRRIQARVCFCEFFCPFSRHHEHLVVLFPLLLESWMVCGKVCRDCG